MKVDVVEYSPEWKVWFEDIANNLMNALNNVTCNVEHVGSTSVQGLDAKPIIDIDIILENFNDLGLAINALEKVGYFHKGNLGIEGREMFEMPSPIHPHNLYVCNPNSLALKNHLTFRNHLRNNIKSAQEYATLKQDLVLKYPNDVDSYCEAKSDFISNILAEYDFDIAELNSIKEANTIDNYKATK